MIAPIAAPKNEHAYAARYTRQMEQKKKTLAAAKNKKDKKDKKNKKKEENEHGEEGEEGGSSDEEITTAPPIPGIDDAARLLVLQSRVEEMEAEQEAMAFNIQVMVGQAGGANTQGIYIYINSP